jgi:hypothetical protein
MWHSAINPRDPSLQRITTHHSTNFEIAKISYSMRISFSDAHAMMLEVSDMSVYLRGPSSPIDAQALSRSQAN